MGIFMNKFKFSTGEAGDVILTDSGFELRVYSETKYNRAFPQAGIWHKCSALRKARWFFKGTFDEYNDILTQQELEDKVCVNCGPVKVPDGLLALYWMYTEGIK